MRAWLVVAALTLSGCVLDDLDLEGRPCPCSDGYQCVDAGGEGVCVGAMDAGAATDGGVGDAAPTDAGADRCETAAALWCDGFEDGLGVWTSVVRDTGMATVVADPAHRGGAALSAEITSAGGKATPIKGWTPPVTTGELWARAWIRVPAGTDVAGLVPLSVGDVTSGFVHTWLGTDDRLALVVGTIPPTVGLAEQTYPRDAWFCLRLHVVVSDSGGSAELFFGDGEANVSALEGLDTRPDMDFTTVLVGIAHAQPEQGPIGIFVDDVVVDTEPVSCAAP